MSIDYEYLKDKLIENQRIEDAKGPCELTDKELLRRLKQTYRGRGEYAVAVTEALERLLDWKISREEIE